MNDQNETGVKYFVPSWFLALFRGELGLGDTFWAGSIGGQLIFVPFWMITAMFAKMISPDLLTYTLLVITGFYAVYYVLLFRATVVVALRNNTAGGWRWAAIVFCLIWAATAVLLAYLTIADFLTTG